MPPDLHEQLLLPHVAGAARRIALTRAVLADLPGLPGRLHAAGVGRVTLALPVPEAVPASFRNGVPARPDLPAVLDAVAPVREFVQAARALGLAAQVEGFPRGVFDGADPEPPVTAMVEVSSRCNLRCPLCSVGRRALSRWGDMPVELFTRIVRDLAGSVQRLALHNLGEPLLHRELPQMIRIAKNAGIPGVFLSTNLAVDAPERIRALAHSGIDEIVCSLDAATPELYPVYRVGGCFEVVRSNLEILTEERRTLAPGGPRVRLQFLLFQHNESERESFRALARRFRVGYEIKVASAPNGQEGWLPADPILRRREREADHGWCSRPYNHTTILSDGAVVPCCKDADGKHALGDAGRSDFLEIWRGSAYREFRAQVLADKSAIPLCRHCPGGWFLGSSVIEREEDPWPA